MTSAPKICRLPDDAGTNLFNFKRKFPPMPEKSGVYGMAGTASMTNFFLQIVPRMDQNQKNIARRAGPQKMVNFGAERVGR